MSIILERREIANINDTSNLRLVFIPIARLLGHFGPACRLGHDDAIHAEDCNGSISGEANRPRFCGEGVVDLVGGRIESAVAFILPGPITKMGEINGRGREEK